MEIRLSATPALTFTLMTSLLFAGCSPNPGSTQPPPSGAEPAVANSPGTPAATETASLPSAGASMPAAGEASPLAKLVQVASTQKFPQVSAPLGTTDPPEVAAPPPTVAESTPAPRPEATTPAPAASPAKPPAHAPIAVDIGGLVEVGATKPGLTRIGSGKCTLCHKLQVDSWAKTAHATRTPPLDCESCHGPGSEYKSLAIMKDSRKAKAAGLVMPGRSFCAKCHTGVWSDDLLKRTHAHKAAS